VDQLCLHKRTSIKAVAFAAATLFAAWAGASGCGTDGVAIPESDGAVSSVSNGGDDAGGGPVNVGDASSDTSALPPTCPAGYADCNQNPGDGCETNLATSHDHCGSCTAACGATEVCSQGQCAVTCANGLTTCNGSCVDVSTDWQNCGSCLHLCSIPVGGVATCQNAACGVACNAGYNACGSSTTCTPDSPTSCGPTCMACPSTFDGTATCSAGHCGIACNPGFVPCGLGSCCQDSDGGDSGVLDCDPSNPKYEIEYFEDPSAPPCPDAGCSAGNCCYTVTTTMVCLPI
jgi:hypothetical protein